MAIENLEKSTEIIEKDNLTQDEEIKRNLYLRKLLTGEVYGPLTNVPNIDKEWLVNYSTEDIESCVVPKETMYSYVLKNNLDNLNAVALSYFGNDYTYRDVFGDGKEDTGLIGQCADALLKKGIKSDDRVTVIMPSMPEAYIMVYALNKIGAVASMVHPLKSENEIKRSINGVRAKMVLTIDSSYNKVKNIINSTTAKDKDVIVASPENSMPAMLKVGYKLSGKSVKLNKKDDFVTWKKFMSEGSKNNSVKPVPYKENCPAVVMETGGTTGSPKGVVLTNENFNGMVEQFKVNAKNFERGDKMLTVMPPFHGFGLCSSIHLPLTFGVTAVLVPRVNIKEVDRLISKNKINHILAVPTFFKGMMKVVGEKEKNGMLKNFDLSNLKYAVSGGSLAKNGFEEEVDQFFAKHGAKIKLDKGYGLSEAVAGVTFADDNMKEENTVGIPMVNTNIKIVDKETEKSMYNGNVGEICVKGPSVMKGYFNNPEATAIALKDGWLHTGDLGYFKDGQLYFSERKGNMIISSGVNVYPNEIEQVIEQHPAVSACAVIGIYHPYKEEVPKAYVALQPGYEISEEIDGEIKDLCHKNLDRYSMPASFEYREELPETLLGKISHAELKKEAEKEIGRQKVYKK